METSFLFVLCGLCGVLIADSAANINNVTLFESKIESNDAVLMPKSVGFVLEQTTKMLMCTVTALNKKWFITPATCLFMIEESRERNKNLIYVVYFAGGDFKSDILKEILIGETKYFYGNDKTCGRYGDVDIGIFKPLIDYNAKYVDAFHIDLTENIDPTKQVQIIGWESSVMAELGCFGKNAFPNKRAMVAISVNLISNEKCQKLRTDINIYHPMVCTEAGADHKYLSSVDIGSAVIQEDKLRGIVTNVSKKNGPAIIVGIKAFGNIPAFSEAALHGFSGTVESLRRKSHKVKETCHKLYSSTKNHLH